MKRSLAGAFALALAAVAAPFAIAQAKTDPIYTGTFSSLAVGGFDPVAYFTDGKAVKGSKDFTHNWMGADWRFASAANRDRFAADPTKYAPQFGGYCAWAAAQGYTAPGDPEHWMVVEGKLYLNYDATVQAKWEKDIPGFIQKANANWPAILAK